MTLKRATWLWILALAAALGIGYLAGAHFGAETEVQIVERPVVRPPEPEADEDDPVPEPVEDWGDEVAPGVYILRSLAPSQMEADEDLRARVERFVEPPIVVAARVYRPESPEHPKGPTDVYLVANPADMEFELHGIYWYGPGDAPTGTAWHREWTLGIGGHFGLVLLDVDGDGREEVMTTSPGANIWRPTIIDLFADEAVWKGKGLPSTKSPWWKFADLDDDGDYEAITEGPARSVAWGATGWDPDEEVFAVYSLQDSEWSLTDVYDEDPTIRR